MNDVGRRERGVAWVGMLLAAVGLFACQGSKAEPTKAGSASDVGVDVDPLLSQPTPRVRTEDLAEVLSYEYSRTLGDETHGLRALAANPDFEVRARAALAMGRVGRTEVIPSLATLQKDEAPRVRSMSSFALALLAVEHHDDREVVGRVRRLLLGAWRAEAVQQADVRRALAWSFRKVGGADAEGLSAVMMEAISSPVCEETALYSLALLMRYAPETPGLFGDVLLKRVRARAESPKQAIRAAASYVLFRVARAEDAERFKTMATSDPDEPMRALAVRGLTASGVCDVALMRRLLLLPAEVPGEIRKDDIRGGSLTQVEAVRHLAHCGTDEAIVALVDTANVLIPDAILYFSLLETAQTDVLIAVVRALAKSTKPEAMDALNTLYRGLTVPKGSPSFGGRNTVSVLRCESALALDTLGKKVQLTPGCSSKLQQPLPPTAIARYEIDAVMEIESDPAVKIAKVKQVAERNRLAMPMVLETLTSMVEDADGAKGLTPDLMAVLSAAGASGVRSHDPVVVAAAASLLAKTRDPSAVGAIKLALRHYARLPGAFDEVSEAAVALIEALAAIEPSAVKAAIEPLLAKMPPLARARVVAVADRVAPGHGLESGMAPAPITASLAGRQSPTRLAINTSRGVIEIELDNPLAPRAVASFRAMAPRMSKTFFHRVIADFVVQGGDPSGTGAGGPGYNLPSEWTWDRFERGSVGMAHGGKDTAGSQFFITQASQPHLDGGYTLIGHVTKGMDVVDRIQMGDQIRSVGAAPTKP